MHIHCMVLYMYMTQYCHSLCTSLPSFHVAYNTFPPHTGKKLYSLAFVGEDVDDPVTRADGEHGEVGESSLELGIAVFAVEEPAKL